LTQERRLQQGRTTRTLQASAAAALAAANASGVGAAAAVGFPGEDGGQSLGEMARRDLDAALQLLADRAQYITGSSGAAIALRRGGKNDMLCRASSGTNAPELGALLSTEFGLSGESVRTRQLLRCDDAERDVRVNRDACRELGIASVAVMPVVNDDEVLGVFELFSGKAHAFGDRDFAALRRLSEMVETAVKLASAAEGLSDRLREKDSPGEAAALQVRESEPSMAEADEEILVEAEVPEEAWAPTAAAELPAESAPVGIARAALASAQTMPAQPSLSTSTSTPPPAPEAAALTAQPAPAQTVRPLLWSMPLDATVDESAELNPSHVPTMLRGLRKCEACGFPVSAGRTLCVECEEKRWRGQLKMPQKKGERIDESRSPDAPGRLSPGEAPPPSKPASTSGTAVAAAAPAPEINATVGATASVQEFALAKETATAFDDQELQALVEPGLQPAIETTAPATAKVQPPELILSAGREPFRSWFAANKVVILAILGVAGAAAALVFLR
jgi:GAF domain-containing protein